MTHLKQTPMTFNHLIDEFFNAPVGYNPPVNIYEQEQSFEMEFNIAGIQKEDIRIQIEKGLLTIQYDHQTSPLSENTKVIRKEFQLKPFKRAFTIDEKINTEGIEACYENGLLKLTLPKKETAIPDKKTITIK